MRFSIISEIPGRTRLQLAGPVPESDLDALLKLGGEIDGVRKVRVYGRIGQMALEYDEQCRASVLDALGALDAQAVADAKSGYVMQLEPRKHKLVMDLATLVGAHYARRWFLPTPLRAVFVVAGYMAFLRAALHELAQPRLTVPVLDASAIGISFVKRDVDTAGQTMFLLNVGELLEDYTRAMSENELINSLLDVPDKAQKVVGDTEVSVAATELEPGDLVAVRTGMSICIDGVVEQGSAMVNQATLTGEPLAVERSVGDDVFAGTVVEDGSILVRVRANTAQTKLRSIVSLVQTADSLKSEGQSHMEDLANKIVPWNFLLAGLVALTTRSLIKTSAALMVDYSCALKLTGSVAVMTAMSDAAKMGVMVKGAKYFESFAKADTIVFDKTGTLTAGSPRVETVHSVNSEIRDTELYQLAAASESLSEHPLGKAIVNGWKNDHREAFPAVSDFRMIPAKGVEASVGGKSVRTGKIGFIADRGDPRASELESAAKRYLDLGDTVIYIAVNGVPSGFIALNDPVRSSVSRSVAELKALGVSPVLLTGDNAVAAKRIAEETGIPRFEANCLPETKLEFLREGERSGKPAAMIGDGVNDAPALKASRVGIAMGGVGSDIAIEAADIVLVKDSIDEVPHLFRLSRRTLRMIKWNITFAMGINLVATGLGMLGLMGPVVGALVHNGGSVFVILNSARLLRDRTREKSEPVNLVPRKA